MKNKFVLLLFLSLSLFGAESMFAKIGWGYSFVHSITYGNSTTGASDMSASYQNIEFGKKSGWMVYSGTISFGSDTKAGSYTRVGAKFGIDSDDFLKYKISKAEFTHHLYFEDAFAFANNGYFGQSPAISVGADIKLDFIKNFSFYIDYKNSLTYLSSFSDIGDNLYKENAQKVEFGINLLI